MVCVINSYSIERNEKCLTEQKSFFTADFNRQDLEARASSPNDVDRWLAAVVLGQVHEEWSFDILKSLKSDVDENTRSAAINALRTFPQKFFVKSTGREDSSSEQFTPGVWKLRPLRALDSDNRELYLAAILDLISTEGPTTGLRIQNMLSKSSIIGTGKRVSRSRVKTLIDELVKFNLLTRADAHMNSNEIELWILHRPNASEFIVRKRNSRDLTEIPVNEAQAVLRASLSSGTALVDKDVAFKILIEQYDIKTNEFFLVGAAMDRQWQTLFLNA